MVSKLNALSFGSATLSIGDMPVSILMASARVPAMELFDLVWYWQRTSVLRACQPAGSTKTQVRTKISSVIQILFWVDVIEVTPPESYIKQNGRERCRQLWPNIISSCAGIHYSLRNCLVHGNNCVLCIDKIVPGFLTSAGTYIALHGFYVTMT